MRNALCHRYNACLTLAAHFKDEFDCSRCRYAGSRHREDADLYGVYLLLLALFKPDRYRQLVRVDVRYSIPIKKSKHKCSSADLQEVVTMKDIDALENEVFRIYKIDPAWRLNKPIKNI